MTESSFIEAPVTLLNERELQPFLGSEKPTGSDEMRALRRSVMEERLPGYLEPMELEEYELLLAYTCGNDGRDHVMPASTEQLRQLKAPARVLELMPTYLQYLDVTVAWTERGDNLDVSLIGTYERGSVLLARWKYGFQHVPPLSSPAMKDLVGARKLIAKGRRRVATSFTSTWPKFAALL